MKKVIQGGQFQGYLVDSTDNDWLTHPNYAAKLIASLRYNQGEALDTNVSIKEEETIVNNIRIPMTNLKLITGGRDEPPTGNWLLDLPIGARFAVQSKDLKNFMGLDLQLCGKTKHTAIVYELFSGMPFGGANGRVIASRFVALFDKVEMLESYEDMIERLEQEQQKQLEVENGPSTGSTALDTDAAPGTVDTPEGSQGERKDNESR